MATQPIKKDNEGVLGWLWLIPAIFVIVGIGLWARKGTAEKSQVAVYPIASDAQDIWPKIGETVKVKIRPDCWSGWINLPPSVNFAIDAPGELEYLFWNSERRFISDNETQFLGDIPHCSFRLRGTTGEATITVQQNKTPLVIN